LPFGYWIKRLGESAKRQVSVVVMDSRLKEFLSSLDSELKYYANPRDDMLNARKMAIVLSNNKVVGCAGIRRDGKLFIVVKEDYQDRGIGSRLMKRVLEGEHHVTLPVDMNNKRAIKLYEKFGFKPTAVFYEWTKPDPNKL